MEPSAKSEPKKGPLDMNAAPVEERQALPGIIAKQSTTEQQK